MIEEFLEVERRTHTTGTVRVTKQVQERQVTLDEVLRHEWVEVERVPVGRAIEGPLEVRYEGDVVIVPIVEERLVVTKQLVLTEELRLTRHSGTHREPQQVRLRREEVIVERLDPQPHQWSAMATSPGTADLARTGASDDASAAASAPADPLASTTDAFPSGTAKNPSS